MVDAKGDKVVNFLGARTFFDKKTNNPFTYETLKVKTDEGNKYRLYAYHGLTFHCAEEGICIATVTAKNSWVAESMLREIAMESKELYDWERQFVKEDHELLDRD